MAKQPLSTGPYRGVRDFYPDDLAIQQYMFDVWSNTAEQFGYARYAASVLEPAELYRSKGAENEEIVNEQTYTFTDRGDREVTLRPEMTPTAARMIAGKRRELTFPVRWYSIPNLFRYERAQRGRLREHWQLNCDIFGSSDVSADIEIIALAQQVFLNFGATEDMFSIRVNDRAAMRQAYQELGITEESTITKLTRLNDRKDKINIEEYEATLLEILDDAALAKQVRALVEDTTAGDSEVIAGLTELGITNVVLDRSLARGFDYYTGTVFEIFDTDPENGRALCGGGRYDNLTELFGGEAIAGIGFGLGDVGMRNFLETHTLLTANIPAPTLAILPTGPEHNLAAQGIAQQFRARGVATVVDISKRKIGKKIAVAGDQFIDYAIVVGEDERADGQFQCKHLHDGHTESGTLEELIAKIPS